MADQYTVIPPGSFDYAEPNDPAINVNPPCTPVVHFNTVSGELFVCVDNTIGANRWIGQMGTVVEP